MDGETAYLHVCVFTLGIRSVSYTGWYEVFDPPMYRFPTHRLIKRSPDFPESLAHLPYLKILPKPEQLLTPLHFSDNELELFRGSHLYGATVDRRSVLHNEWQGCLEYLVTTPGGDVCQRGYTW